MASGLPEKMSVTMVLAAIRRLQQRDCPGFSPDSLFIDCASQRQPNRNASVKVHKFFPRKQQIYTQKFPILENF